MDNYPEITSKQYQEFINATYNNSTKNLYAYLLGIEAEPTIIAESFFYKEGDWFDIVIWKFLLDSGFDPKNIGTIMFATLIRGLIQEITGDIIPNKQPSKLDDASEKEKIKSFIEEKFGYKINGTVVKLEENNKALSRLIPPIFTKKAEEAQSNHLNNTGKNCKYNPNSDAKISGISIPIEGIREEMYKSYQSSFYNIDADIVSLAQVLADIIEQLIAYRKPALSPYNNVRVGGASRQSRILAQEYHANKQ